MAKTSVDDVTLAKAINHLADVHEKQFAAIATELGNVALQLKYLGNGDAGTTIGALEHLAVKIKESADTIADAMREEI